MVPLTASIDIDPVRQLIFAVQLGAVDDTMRVYDIAGDELNELDGSPIPLQEDYPQENSSGFTAHYLKVDPWHARVYAGRSQGILSELIAYSYDEVIPGPDRTYTELANMDLVSMLEDGIDVDVYYEDRISLLAAYQAMPDPVTGDVYLSADAWNGSASTQVFLAYRSDLSVYEGCDDDDDDQALCHWRGSTDGGPSSSFRTGEGISCYDWTHDQAMGLSIDFVGEYLSHYVRFDADRGLLPQAHPPGSTDRSGTYAIGLACH